MSVPLASARISFVGELAARLGYLLLPYMDGTDKGDQFLRVLRIAGGDVKENKLIYEKRHPRTHGENNPNVKLTKTQVNAIRRAASNHSRLTHKEKYGMNLVTNLAKRFDVTNATIQNVIRGSTW